MFKPDIRQENRQEKMVGTNEVIRLFSDPAWKAPVKQGKTQSDKLLLKFTKQLVEVSNHELNF